MIHKENFCLELATQECHAISVHSLLGAVVRDHFEWSVDGWVKQYSKRGIETKEEAALQWVTDHYDSISAAVRAARDLSEAIAERASNLWLDAIKLIPADDRDPA